MSILVKFIFFLTQRIEMNEHGKLVLNVRHESSKIDCQKYNDKYAGPFVAKKKLKAYL